MVISCMITNKLFGEKPVSEIKWKDIKVQKRIYGHTVATVTSYCLIDEDNLALLISEDRRIVIYSIKNQKPEREISLKSSPIDFTYDRGNFYLLDFNKLTIIGEGGNILQELLFKLPEQYPFAVERITRVNGRNFVQVANGSTWEITSNGLTEIDKEYWHFENGFTGRTERIDPESFKVICRNNQLSLDKEISLKEIRLTDYLATVRIVSIDNSQIIYDIETSSNKQSDNPRRFLVFTDFSGNFISKTEIPFVYFSAIKNSFIKSKKGILYSLMADDGMYFYEFSKEKHQINLPVGCREKHHYNSDLLNLEPENHVQEEKIELKSAAIGSNCVTRTQVFQNAYKFGI